MVDAYVIEVEYRSCAIFSGENWYQSTRHLFPPDKTDVDRVLRGFDKEHSALIGLQGDRCYRHVIDLPA